MYVNIMLNMFKYLTYLTVKYVKNLVETRDWVKKNKKEKRKWEMVLKLNFAKEVLYIYFFNLCDVENCTSLDFSICANK